MKVTADVVEGGDLLGAVLVDDVAVGHLDGGGVAQVDLVLAGAPLALAALDGDAGGVHPLRIWRISHSSLVVWRMW